MRYLHLMIILIFLAGMIYAASLVYYGKPRPVLTPASFPTIQVEKKISELRRQLQDRSSTVSSGEIGLDDISPTSGEDKAEPIGGGVVAEVKLPGFSVSLPESSSWMTVAKMISLILLTYLGVKTINLFFSKMEMSLLRRRARRA